MDYERLYKFRFRRVDQTARGVVWRELAAFIHEALPARSAWSILPSAAGEFINAVPAPER